MIDFMLQQFRQIRRKAPPHALAELRVAVSQRDRTVAPYAHETVGQAEAVVPHDKAVLAAPGDLRVDQRDRPGAEVDHDHPARDADLRSGDSAAETVALPVQGERRAERVQIGMDAGIERLDGRGSSEQARIAVDENRPGSCGFGTGSGHGESTGGLRSDRKILDGASRRQAAFSGAPLRLCRTMSRNLRGSRQRKHERAQASVYFLQALVRQAP
jgi:hypothetical protein